jgi:putative ABC transport system permease protein
MFTSNSSIEKRALTTARLSLENLKARPARTACLMAVTAILASALFGGAVLTLNLRQGLTAMTRRFGADLMVVPAGAAERARSILLQGAISYFYFDAAIAGKVSQTEGVTCATTQFFLTSLAESCCDAMIQLIAYDPATDFVITPWVAEKYNEPPRGKPRGILSVVLV